MDYLKLVDIPKNLSYCGTFLDIETCELLKYSLLILQKENHFRKIYYFGKIFGAQADYHISFGYKSDCYRESYYYSTDGITWFLLPKPDKVTQKLALLATTIFEGDPSMVLEVKNENFQLADLNDIDAEESLPNFLIEENRLAATVELIKKDAIIIPRGAWFKCPDGSVIENSTFEGLSLIEASDLKSYLHARPPLLKWNTNLLTRPDYNYSLDFLDSIDLDEPLGCWSLKLVSGERLVTLQSLYWPGLTFYHKLDTPDYGLLYIGYGNKNIALPHVI